MALLDVTSLLVDPDLADQIVVYRRAATTGNNGVTNISILQLAAIGVVTSDSPDDLKREADYESMSRTISIVSQFAFRGPAPGYMPDVVLWQGNHFVVTKVDPYTNFGPGFVEVALESYEFTDVQPQDYLPTPGELVFAGASQSGLIPLL